MQILKLRKNFTCYNYNMEYFGAIDQGTTSTRFAIFDSEENQSCYSSN